MDVFANLVSYIAMHDVRCMYTYKCKIILIWTVGLRYHVFIVGGDVGNSRLYSEC